MYLPGRSKGVNLTCLLFVILFDVLVFVYTLNVFFAVANKQLVAFSCTLDQQINHRRSTKLKTNGNYLNVPSTGIT